MTFGFILIIFLIKMHSACIYLSGKKCRYIVISANKKGRLNSAHSLKNISDNDKFKSIRELLLYTLIVANSLDSNILLKMYFTACLKFYYN